MGSHATQYKRAYIPKRIKRNYCGFKLFYYNWSDIYLITFLHCFIDLTIFLTSYNRYLYDYAKLQYCFNLSNNQIFGLIITCQDLFHYQRTIIKLGCNLAANANNYWGLASSRVANVHFLLILTCEKLSIMFQIRFCQCHRLHLVDKELRIYHTTHIDHVLLVYHKSRSIIFLRFDTIKLISQSF